MMATPIPIKTILHCATRLEPSMKCKSVRGNPRRSSGASALVNDILNLSAAAHKMNDAIEEILLHRTRRLLRHRRTARLK